MFPASSSSRCGVSIVNYSVGHYVIMPEYFLDELQINQPSEFCMLGFVTPGSEIVRPALLLGVA